MIHFLIINTYFLNIISDKVWYGFYFILLIKNCEKNTKAGWHFYNFTKLFLKDINKGII